MISVTIVTRNINKLQQLCITNQKNKNQQHEN